MWKSHKGKVSEKDVGGVVMSGEQSQVACVMRHNGWVGRCVGVFFVALAEKVSEITSRKAVGIETNGQTSPLFFRANKKSEYNSSDHSNFTDYGGRL